MISFSRQLLPQGQRPKQAPWLPCAWLLLLRSFVHRDIRALTWAWACLKMRDISRALVQAPHCACPVLLKADCKQSRHLLPDENMQDAAVRPCTNCPDSATPPLSSQPAKEELGFTLRFSLEFHLTA